MKEYDVIIKPLLTEKSYSDVANKKYAFIVKKDASKAEIKKAIESIFGVSVEKVNTLNYDGKFKVQGRNQGYTSKFKKAYVTLKADSKTLEFFDSLS